jgi:hypothetical protein
MDSEVSTMDICMQWPLMSWSGRLVRQTLPDNARKIADFKQALLSLKVAFDSGTVIQTAFVSTRTLEAVEKLGA